MGIEAFDQSLLKQLTTGFPSSGLIKSWHLVSKVFEVRVMRDCWHRYKVTICKFPPGPGGTIWGVTPGPSPVLPTLMRGPGHSGPYCLPPLSGLTRWLQEDYQLWRHHCKTWALPEEMIVEGSRYLSVTLSPGPECRY